MPTVYLSELGDHCCLSRICFSDSGEYLYQVGAQIDMSDKNPAKVSKQLASLERMLQLLPSSLSCTHATDMHRGIMPTLKSGDASFSVLPPAVEVKLAEEVAAPPPAVETGKGGDRDQYGKKFGKKHKNVLRS